MGSRCETNQRAVQQNTAIDDFVTMITQDLSILSDDPKRVVVICFILMIVAIFSMMLNRFGEQKRRRNLVIFQDEAMNFRNGGSGDSCVEMSSNSHEKYLSELYSAADKCFIKKYAERCRILVDHCPYMMNVKFESTGQTPFHRVCFHGEASLVEFMLERGANPRLNSDAGETPICLAFHYYLKSKNYREVESISCLDILHRAGCSFGENGIWYDILLKMAIRGDNKSLTEWLLTIGSDAGQRRICAIKKMERKWSEPPIMKIPGKC